MYHIVFAHIPVMRISNVALLMKRGLEKKKKESLSGELLHNDSSGLGKEHSTPFDGEL